MRTGVDDDGDGVLDDAEIDETTLVCAALELWSGDVTAADWSDPSKVATLKGVRVIAGSLAIGAAPAALPLLAHVLGDVSIAAPAATTALPALAQIGGKLTVETGAAAISLPALAEVGGDLDLRAGAGALSVGSETPFEPPLRVHGELRVAGDTSRIASPSLYTVDGALRIAAGAHGALSLPALDEVGGDLDVKGAPALHLDHLRAIGGGIVIDTPPQPLGLDLPALASLGGGLRVVHGALTSVDLPHLRGRVGELVLDGQPLTRLVLPLVTSVAGDISLTGAGALTAIDLGSLMTAGNIAITSAPGLTALALPVLDTAGRSGPPGQPAGIRLIATGVTAIAWPWLSAVTGDVYLSGNAALQSVQLADLRSAASLQVIGSPLLSTVAAPRLAGDVPSAMPPDIAIGGPVQTLELGALTRAGTIVLDGVALLDLSGLRGLQTASLLRLRSATRLHDLHGLAAAGRISSLELEHNGALTSLDGLERLLRVPGHLRLSGNAMLTSVAGLRNVTYIGDAAELRDCPALAALAFPALAAIGGSLDITGLSAVTSLAGLGPLTAVDGAIHIASNSSLPASEIDAFLARLGH